MKKYFLLSLIAFSYSVSVKATEDVISQDTDKVVQSEKDNKDDRNLNKISTWRAILHSMLDYLDNNNLGLS